MLQCLRRGQHVDPSERGSLVYHGGQMRVVWAYEGKSRVTYRFAP